MVPPTRWINNGSASFDLKEGNRYRLRMRNTSDDIHPIHLHRHTFELSKIAEQPTIPV